MDAAFPDEVEEVTQQGTPVRSLRAMWDMQVKINDVTWVVTVGVPAYDPANPIEGIKEGRESFLNNMRVDNGNRLVMCYRDKLEKESRVRDPYFPMAPHFTNVSHSTIEEGACSQNISVDCLL